MNQLDPIQRLLQNSNLTRTTHAPALSALDLEELLSIRDAQVIKTTADLEFVEAINRVIAARNGFEKLFQLGYLDNPDVVAAKNNTGFDTVVQSSTDGWITATAKAGDVVAANEVCVAWQVPADEEWDLETFGVEFTGADPASATLRVQYKELAADAVVDATRFLEWFNNDPGGDGGRALYPTTDPYSGSGPLHGPGEVPAPPASWIYLSFGTELPNSGTVEVLLRVRRRRCITSFA